MTHCKRCRADAVGLLDDDRSGEMAGCLSACSRLELPPGKRGPTWPWATREAHAGQPAPGRGPRKFQVWGLARRGAGAGGKTRQAPPAGAAPRRWEALAPATAPCAELPRGAVRRQPGPFPAQLLAEYGLDRGGLLRVHHTRHASRRPWAAAASRPSKARAGRGRTAGMLRWAQSRARACGAESEAVRTAGSEKTRSKPCGRKAGRAAMNTGDPGKSLRVRSPSPCTAPCRASCAATSPSRSTRARSTTTRPCSSAKQFVRVTWRERTARPRTLIMTGQDRLRAHQSAGGLIRRATATIKHAPPEDPGGALRCRLGGRVGQCVPVARIPALERYPAWSPRGPGRASGRSSWCGAVEDFHGRVPGQVVGHAPGGAHAVHGGAELESRMSAR